MDYLNFDLNVDLTEIATSSFNTASPVADFSEPVLGFLNLVSKNHLTIGVLIIVSLCLVISIVAFLHWMWYGKARIVGIASAVVFGLVFIQILAMIFLQIRNW